jgi:hypothetical protein
MLGGLTLAFANERRAGEQDRDHRDLVDQRYDSAERAPGQVWVLTQPLLNIHRRSEYGS